MRNQISPEPRDRPNQLGSVLIVAMISILSVGAIAAGTNAVLTQDTVTANEKTRALQGLSVGDAARLQSNPNSHSALSTKLYKTSASLQVSVLPAQASNTYNAIIRDGTAEYGYRFQTGIPSVTSVQDLKDAAPGIGEVCELPTSGSIGNSIDLTCELTNDTISITEPWQIKNLDADIKLGILLEGSNLELNENFEIYGKKVEILIEDMINSNLNFKGVFAAVADEKKASVELESLENDSIQFNEGVIVSGEKAEMRVEDILNMDFSINGPLIVNGRDDAANLRLDSLENETASITGPVYVTGEKAELRINESINTTFEFDNTIIVDGKEKKSYVKIKSIENERMDINGGILAAGRAAEIKIEDMTNVDLVFGDTVQFVSTKTPKKNVRFSINSFTNNRIDFTGSVIGHGQKAEILFNGFENATAKIHKELYLFADNNEALLQIGELKNDPFVFEEDTFIHGQPARYRFNNLENTEVEFKEHIYVAPNQLDAEAKGTNGELTIDGETEATDYQSPNACDDFGAVECTDESSIRMATDAAKTQLPPLSTIEANIDYAGLEGEGEVNIIRH